VPHGVFELIALVLAVCVAAGVVASLLRLPLLVGLLVAGVLVGPEVFGLVEASEEIELLGEIGIALLLFVVGLKLDPRLVRRLGPAVLAAGVIQVTLTAGAAFLIARAGGLESVQALYVAAAMAFSSTVIVVKLLTDRRELEQLHGRIALGILIIQDIVVVGLMIVLAAFDPTEQASLLAQVGGIVLRGTLLLGGTALLARFVLPRLTHVLARQGELLVLASVTWAVALAALAIVFGFSGEVGAFIAGVALAASEYRDAISARLTTLRDFLLVFFFIDLGVRLELGGLGDIGLVFGLSLFVLIVKPWLIAAITTSLGFRPQTGVRAGLTLAQISEFSLILVALGVGLGQVDGRTVGIVTAVALITITASTYLSSRADRLIPKLAPALRPFTRANPFAADETPTGNLAPTAIVIGLGRLGRTVLDELLERGDDVLGVDFDPRSVRAATTQIPVLYGDAEDPELPHHLPLTRTRWVVSTLRDVDAHRSLLAALRHHGYRGRVAVAVDSEHDERAMLAAGADLAIRPFHVAAGPFVQLLHLAGVEQAEQAGPEEPSPGHHSES
jgi:Kef-type K+ transport system membrane component KefB